MQLRHLEVGRQHKKAAVARSTQQPVRPPAAAAPGRGSRQFFFFLRVSFFFFGRRAALETGWHASGSAGEMKKRSRPRPAEQCLSAAALSRHGARRRKWGRSGAAGKRRASHHEAREGCGVGSERWRPGCRPGAERARCSTLLAGAHPVATSVAAAARRAGR